MKRKILFFAGLSVLIILVGLPLSLKQNWSQFSNRNKSHPVLTDTLSLATVFNEFGSMSLQVLIVDSARLMFRFTPNTCSCLESDFTESVNRSINAIGESKILVVVAAENTKDILLFRKRTKLSCPIYGTSDTLLASFDTNETPYACLVFPDRIARNIITIPSDNIDEFLSYAKKIIH